jgi:hypothetical protein
MKSSLKIQHKGYGIHTMVNGQDGGDENLENGWNLNEIWLTQTVDVERHSDHGRV